MKSPKLLINKSNFSGNEHSLEPKTKKKHLVVVKESFDQLDILLNENKDDSYQPWKDSKLKTYKDGAKTQI